MLRQVLTESHAKLLVKKKGSVMADQELRDRNNKLIGKIRTRSDGKLELVDPFNFLKGIYDPKSNETRDRDLRFVGKGNLLTTLL